MYDISYKSVTFHKGKKVASEGGDSSYDLFEQGKQFLEQSGAPGDYIKVYRVKSYGKGLRYQDLRRVIYMNNSGEVRSMGPATDEVIKALVQYTK